MLNPSITAAPQRNDTTCNVFISPKALRRFIVSTVDTFLYSALLGISFLYYWPTLLALVSRAAPAKVNATLMGLAFMSLFIANNLIGWIGGFYEKMSPAQFWTMHAAIAIVGGVLVVIFGRRLSRLLDPVPLSPEFSS